MSLAWIFRSLLIFSISLQARALPVGPSAPKAYAVFVASYSETGDRAIGGVAGTAFFVSPQKAITAFHVLQASSFQTAPGYDHHRVWLVHENEPAIEIESSWLEVHAQQDSTIIHFPSDPKVPSAYIFAMATSAASGDLVESDGYRAGTAGPVFEHKGSDLKIVSVPHLERLHASGKILRSARINLTASDVNLSEAPCVQLSYTPIVGLSGGPVLVNGRVIGMNSFADPEHRDSTWALRVQN